MGDVSERLIAEVKCYPYLFDKTNEDYKKYDYRVKAWTAIGEKLDLSASAAQAKWKNLRDNMVKHLKRNSSTSTAGDGPKKVKQYKFADMMQFIVPFLELNRVGDMAEESNNIMDQDSTFNANNTNIDDNSVKNQTESLVDSSLVTVVERVQEREQSNGCAAGGKAGRTPSQSSPPPPHTTTKKRKRRYVKNSFEQAQLVGSSPPPPPPPQDADLQGQADDDIGRFLSSMAGSIRKLPPHIQARVRFSIHKIVHDAELEYLYPS